MIVHTCWISLKSWLTSIMPPSNSLTASANASIVSISRWLVGSSRNNMWGFCQASQAKHTRHFWPSDRFLIGLTWEAFKVQFRDCCRQKSSNFALSRSLSPGKSSHSHLLFSCQAIATNDLPHLLLLFDLWETLHHVLQRRQIQLQLLCQVLLHKTDT